MNNEYYGYAPSYLASRQPANTTNIMWTMGLEGAKAYPIAPGRTILLMDSECAKFYIKTMDANGFATLRTFTFAEEEQVASHPDYVTKEQLEASIAAVLEQLAAKSSQVSSVPPSQTLL
jgi:hypothetical protein